jgi:hypothetical protein
VVSVIHVCAECVPAGIEFKRLDDYRGNCRGCGVRDGNLRRVELPALIEERGDYVTESGRVVVLTPKDFIVSFDPRHGRGDLHPRMFEGLRRMQLAEAERVLASGAHIGKHGVIIDTVNVCRVEPLPAEPVEA